MRQFDLWVTSMQTVITEVKSNDLFWCHVIPQGAAPLLKEAVNPDSAETYPEFNSAAWIIVTGS